MEDINKMKNEERGCERFALLIFSLYNISMICASIRMQWENWMTFSLISLLVVAWVVFLGKYRDYQFRAKFVTILIQISINLYAIFEKDLSNILLILIAYSLLVTYSTSLAQLISTSLNFDNSISVV